MNLKTCLTIACCVISASSMAQKGKDVFQVSIYSPPPPRFMNDEQYRTMKEAHIDVIFNVGQYTEATREGNLKTLDLAAKHGLRVYAHDTRLSQDDGQIRAMVADYKAHKALGGYYITDEPDSARLDAAVALMNKEKALKEISAKTGKSQKAPFDKGSRMLTAEFLPGEGRLYALN